MPRSTKVNWSPCRAGCCAGDMRLLPPLVLLVLSPCVGESLLCNVEPVSSSWLASLLPLVLLYGGGALVIREMTRRLCRGYPIMALFAVGYALLEEGII